MNIVDEFAQYLESQSVATVGQDLFVSRAPASTAHTQFGTVGDRIFWLKSAGGSSKKMINGGSLITKTIELYHRDINTQSVYDTLEDLGISLTQPGCVTLTGYTVVSVSTRGPWTDQDLDSEERQIGLLQVSITFNNP